ncbi:receptor-like protein EIX1 [Salvia miltiorrhiza]|uniref:receptor-like protein EIX1 n=1 Tax=Salvia miltiorrhiza TaxID=226208 RepID=UPI0025AC9F07|nr:receptor-like protein EIX1 [Salvia miltiorrhiza]
MGSSNPTINATLSFFLIFLSLKLCNSIFCPQIEKHSLLSFKQSLQDPYHHLSSWHDDDGEVNCCKWNGVICNNSTGHVHQLHLHGFNLSGQINPSLLNLTHLTRLDLSLNAFKQTIPPFIGSLTNLEHLNLSFAGFHGEIPHNIGNLSYLRSLDLAAFPNIVSAGHLNYYHSIHLAGYPVMEFAADVKHPNMLHVDSLEWLSRLSQLEHLNMNFVNLTKATNWAQVINKIPSLQNLHFQNCSLDYISPLNHLNNTSLTLLDLSSNNFHSFEVPKWILRLNNLRYLDLRNNSFVGPIPASSNATKLEYIDLSFNSLNSTVPSWFNSCTDLEFVALDFNFLTGEIPAGFTNLCKTRRLSLSYNNFQGKMSDSFGNMSECFLEALEVLDLQFNHLSGELIDQLGEFKNLQYFNLNKNLVSGPIPANMGKLFSLKILSLGGNNLTENLPNSLGQLWNLERIYIFDNKLEGVVTESLFANLTKLELFSASSNQLSLEVSQSWIPPFQLIALGLGSWNLGSKIPSWLETQRNLSAYLDLSNTGISGSVPRWFWEIRILNLSHNHLGGEFPDVRGASSQFIYLSGNQFEGPLPRVGDSLKELDLSDNSFTGGIAHFLCDAAYETYSLEILHLGENLLSGELPNCWMKWPFFEIFEHRQQSNSLNLDNNRFSGEIPFSMHNCTKLVKMGLADNNLGGNIPTWIGTSLVELRILILRSNNLSGQVSSEICKLSSLQILDLSSNELSGLIPRCIRNFTAMVERRSLLDLLQTVLGMRNHGILTLIDLSINNLSGDIPNELTSLSELGSLNLSGNHLTGLMPENIGEMKQLESLDLSRNSLSGPIPTSLALISGLGYLDLSFNNLTGRIPESTQLQSFNASSFIGNDLCGPPLASMCSDEGGGGKEENEKEEAEVDWFYVFLSLGYAVGFSMVCTALALKKKWRDAYFGLVERMWRSLTTTPT